MDFVNGRWGVLLPHSKGGWNPAMPVSGEKKLKKLSLETLCKHCNHCLAGSSKSGCSELATTSAPCFHFVSYWDSFFSKNEDSCPWCNRLLRIHRYAVFDQDESEGWEGFIDLTAFLPNYWLQGLKMKQKVIRISGVRGFTAGMPSWCKRLGDKRKLQVFQGFQRLACLVSQWQSLPNNMLQILQT